MSIGFAEVEFITRLALRECLWAQMESERLFVRYDYNYYVDIGTIDSCDEAVKQVCEMKLSMNKWDEPYPFHGSNEEI
jgi:hypothetical protein